MELSTNNQTTDLLIRTVNHLSGKFFDTNMCELYTRPINR